MTCGLWSFTPLLSYSVYQQNLDNAMILTNEKDISTYSSTYNGSFKILVLLRCPSPYDCLINLIKSVQTWSSIYIWADAQFPVLWTIDENWIEFNDLWHFPSMLFLQSFCNCWELRMARRFRTDRDDKLFKKVFNFLSTDFFIIRSVLKVRCTTKTDSLMIHCAESILFGRMITRVTCFNQSIQSFASMSVLAIH